MKKATTFLASYRLVLVPLFLICLNSFSQNKSAEVLIGEANPDFYFQLDDEGKSTGNFRYYTISFREKGQEYLERKTAILKKQESGGFKLISAHSNKNLLNGTFLKGKVKETAQVKGSILIITADTIKYGQSFFVEYELYRLVKKTQQLIPFAMTLFSSFNTECSGKNYTSNPKLVVKSEKEVNFVIDFELNGCSANKKQYTWTFKWNPKKEKLDVETINAKDEINQYINQYQYPEDGLWIVDRIEIDGRKNFNVTKDGKQIQYKDVFVKFENGKATLCKMGKDLKLQNTDWLKLDTSDIAYKVKFLDYNFQGYYSFNDKNMFIEGRDVENKVAYRLVLQNTYSNSSSSQLQELIETGFEPTTSMMWNDLRLNRSNALSIYEKKGLMKSINYQTWDGNSVNRQTSRQLALMTDNAEIVKIFFKQNEFPYFRSLVENYLSHPENNEVKVFLESLVDVENQRLQEEKNKEADRLRLRIAQDIEESLQKSNGFLPDTKIEVTNVLDREDLQVHNITITYYDGNTADKSFFEMHQLELGRWKSYSESYAIDDELMRAGNVLEAVNIDDHLFLYVQSTSIFRTFNEVVHNLFLYDSESFELIGTNLNNMSSYDYGSCDYTVINYEYLFDKANAKTIEIKTIQINFKDCNEEYPKIKKSTYRWSSRQNKFLESLD